MLSGRVGAGRFHQGEPEDAPQSLENCLIESQAGWLCSRRQSQLAQCSGPHYRGLGSQERAFSIMKVGTRETVVGFSKPENEISKAERTVYREYTAGLIWK